MKSSKNQKTNIKSLNNIYEMPDYNESKRDRYSKRISRKITEKGI